MGAYRGLRLIPGYLSVVTVGLSARQGLVDGHAVLTVRIGDAAQKLHRWALALAGCAFSRL